MVISKHLLPHIFLPAQRDRADCRSVLRSVLGSCLSLIGRLSRKPQVDKAVLRQLLNFDRIPIRFAARLKRKATRTRSTPKLNKKQEN